MPRLPTGASTASAPRRPTRNGDGRDLGSATFTATLGTALSVSVDDLRGRGLDLTTVDPNFVVGREENIGSRLGAYVARSTSGRLTFEPSPATRIVWTMNALNHADCAGAAADVRLPARSGCRR